MPTTSFLSFSDLEKYERTAPDYYGWQKTLKAQTLPQAPLLVFENKILFPENESAWAEFEGIPCRKLLADEVAGAVVAALLERYGSLPAAVKNHLLLFKVTIDYLQKVFGRNLTGEEVSGLKVNLFAALNMADNEKNNSDFEAAVNLSADGLELLNRYYPSGFTLILFSRFSENERAKFKTLLGGHSWKRNVIAELIENLYDLTGREAMLDELIGVSESLSEKQARYRSDWIRERLFNKRYPRLSAKQSKVKEAIAAIPKHGLIKTVYPENAENNYLSLEIQLRNSDDLARLLSIFDDEAYKKAVTGAIDAINAGNE